MAKITKTIARKILFPFLSGIGIPDLLLRFSSKKGLIVNFHGVTSLKGNRFNNRHLDTQEFESTIIYLKKKFEIVPLKDLFELYESKAQIKKKTIALTFDDGYINNFTDALPVLKKYNVPATFYLISKSLTDDSYYVWPDIIDLVQRECKEDIVLENNVFRYPGFYCGEIKMSLIDFLKSCGSKRDGYIQMLAEKYPSYKTVINKYPQLIELIRKNNFHAFAKEPLIEYGSHTHAHYNLEYLNGQECFTELNESKKIIESFTGREVISLAFPDGSYSKNTLDIASKAGYKNMVAVEYKFNENNEVKGLLSRYTISNSTTVESNMLRLAKDFDKYGI